MAYKSEEKTTTITISRKNHQTLSGMGKKGQSFDQILTEVLTRKKSVQLDYSCSVDLGARKKTITQAVDAHEMAEKPTAGGSSHDGR
jgi:predicted CopG family antitoxin